MPVQRSQGRRRPLVPRHDELPDGIPATPSLAAERDEAGRLIPSAGTLELARKGGQARAESIQIARMLSLVDLPDGHSYARYARMAREFRDQHTSELAATVGAGRIGPGPASIIASAALQLAASRYLSDLGARNGDARMLLDASRLADASRSNLLSAHELVAKEAAARQSEQPDAFWLRGSGVNASEVTNE